MAHCKHNKDYVQWVTFEVTILNVNDCYMSCTILGRWIPCLLYLGQRVFVMSLSIPFMNAHAHDTKPLAMFQAKKLSC